MQSIAFLFKEVGREAPNWLGFFFFFFLPKQKINRWQYRYRLVHCSRFYDHTWSPVISFLVTPWWITTATLGRKIFPSLQLDSCNRRKEEVLQSWTVGEHGQEKRQSPHQHLRAQNCQAVPQHRPSFCCSSSPLVSVQAMPCLHWAFFIACSTKRSKKGKRKFQHQNGPEVPGTQTILWLFRKRSLNSS